MYIPLLFLKTILWLNDLSSLVAFWSLPNGPSLVTIKDFHLIWLLAQNWPLLMPSFKITVKLTMPQIAFSKEHLCLEDC